MNCAGWRRVATVQASVQNRSDNAFYLPFKQHTCRFLAPPTQRLPVGGVADGSSGGPPALGARPGRAGLVRPQHRGNYGPAVSARDAGGLHLYLEGDANDYVGKGMAAGRIVLKPPNAATYVARNTVIMGNTCLYGATGGQMFAAGQAGERFAVRNSGAVAVVEGTGDHCCEYMTGGVVCVLGRTGLNFGAGLTGGFAYVLDLERAFVDRYNHELIDIHRLTNENMLNNLQHLEELMRLHVAETGSVWGDEILNDLRSYIGHFWLVKPKAASIDSLIEHLRRAA